LLITVDDLQVAASADLALIAAALHRLNVSHPKSVVVFAATGLPTTPDASLAAGVTHWDRLVPPQRLPATLSPADAAYAIVEPARLAGVLWEREAVDLIVTATNGYPAHIQLFADRAWAAAAGADRITSAEAHAAARAGTSESANGRLLAGADLRSRTAASCCPRGPMSRVGG
jgi:hypothetical protein